MLVEEDIDDNSLRRPKGHVLDELLPLDPAGVAADELHSGAGQATRKTRVFAVLVR